MTMSANLRGIAFMVLGMFGLAVTDALLKFLGGSVPLGQLLFLQGLGCGIVFTMLALRSGASHWTRTFFQPLVIWRNLFEVIAAVSFLSALTLVPLSTLSSILQANPLMVTLGAALWLKEPVGPRRWAAILVGLFGVLIVIRPWSAGFDLNAIFALIATVGLALRDLITRRMPPDLSTTQIGAYAMYLMMFSGIGLLLARGETPTAMTTFQWSLMGAIIVILSVGYFGVTAAMRVGEVGVITPFRYSRIVFALILAIVVFGEEPDAMTYIGAAIIVLSGLYTLWREQIARAR